MGSLTHPSLQAPSVLAAVISSAGGFGFFLHMQDSFAGIAANSPDFDPSMRAASGSGCLCSQGRSEVSRAASADVADADSWLTNNKPAGEFEDVVRRLYCSLRKI